MEDYSFEFNVPDYMKGKYTKAVIEYPPALQRASQPATRAGTHFQADDQRWRLAGDRSPVQSGVDALERERQRQLELQRKVDLDRQYDLERQRADYERLQRERESSQYAEQKRLLEQRQLDEQFARLRYEQEQAASRARQAALLPTTTTPTWPGLLTDRYADRRFDNSALVTPPAVVAAPAVRQNDSLVTEMFQRMMKSSEDRIAQLSKENEDYRRRFGNGYHLPADSERSHVGYQNDLVSNTRETRPVTPVESNPAPQIQQRNPLSMGRIDGKAPMRETTRKRGSWDLLMFLLLLASVALNLYLWAVSRGFYMRYQELADELRETFAVSST